MNARIKLHGSFIIASLVLISMFGTVTAQTGDAVGTVDLTVVECNSVTNHGVVGSAPADCVNAGGSFTFYLRGDGTADYDQLHVLAAEGRGSINLNPGVYEVVEESTQTHFDVTVTSGETTHATFAFASGNAPEVEPVRLYVTSLVCKNYEAASFDPFNGTIPEPCTRVGGDVFSLYLYGDGTNDYVQVTSSASGEAYIDLHPGRYEIVHEPTQMTTTLELSSDYSMVFTRPEPVDHGAPTPSPTVTPKPAGTTVTPTPASVSKLPNTGAGEANDGFILMIAAASGALLLAGASIRLSKSA